MEVQPSHQRAASSVFTICKSVDPNSDDRFVGLKMANGRPELVFPLGYSLPFSDVDAKSDARQLLRVLSSLQHEHQENWIRHLGSTTQQLGFDLHAHFLLIENYIRTQTLVSERHSSYILSFDGQIDWPRTLSTLMPVATREGLVYLDLVSKRNNVNLDSLITLAHKLALYKSFQLLGWLFTGVAPRRPRIIPPKSRLLAALEVRIRSTFNDLELSLLRAIMSVLKQRDSENPTAVSKFGTVYFEFAWEKMVDLAFGSSLYQKSDFFPRSVWAIGDQRPYSNPLFPDTIMHNNRDIFVLDAKYYRFGCTGDPSHLPKSADIAKQVVYGEYASRVSSSYGDALSGRVYNAFIFPGELPDAESQWCKVVGYSKPEWVLEPRTPQTVLAVVVDSRYLLRNHVSSAKMLRHQLAACIRNATREYEIPNFPDPGTK